MPFGGKWSLYCSGIRVASFLRWPGHIQPSSSTDAMLQYIDIVPTLAELAGGNPKLTDTGQSGAADGTRGFDGRSVLTILKGE